MPLFVTSPETDLTGFSLEGFDCERSAYDKIESIKPFNVSGQFIAYASPDSTYAVTKRLLDLAKKEILIGIYDFSATYIKELLLNAMERNVKVTLMLDVNLKEEEKIFEELKQFGCTTIPAPSCANKKARYFPNCHEKFVVIDDEWILVQSGNYSKNSIPFNEEDGGNPANFKNGNRDMGVAIQSKKMAAFFKELLLSDIKLVLNSLSPEALQTCAKVTGMLVEAVPELIPANLFPSKTFKPQSPVKVLPVISPDNYMDQITKWLSAAKKSIYIENQYIRSGQTEIKKLLNAIASARVSNPNLDVRIVLGKLFSAGDGPKEKLNIKNLRTIYGLKLDENIRYINIRRFVHCHNKLIIVDGESVLISSQNWSDTAVSLNREAGVILYYPEMAEYYASIFDSDWKTGLKRIPIPGTSDAIAPEALMEGNYTEVSLADYEEV